MIWIWAASMGAASATPSIEALVDRAGFNYFSHELGDFPIDVFQGVGTFRCQGIVLADFA